ncbi:hypothetical protein HGM15179_006405 [Zosterops borbonicus]|uniref:Uncharacterized protein n=1 Tax=Zosterops borbonicus TaxID=364589 RepID=A0A8K1GMU8_9PASS|nr:hypothetical protein HGM15179_006405 [Zosterops borbonicus]
MAWGWAEQAESDEREREEEMQEPESGWASRAGYNIEEDDAPARQGRKSQFSIVLLAPSQITPGPACKADHIFDLTLDREVEHYGYHNTTAVTERASSHSGK